MQDRFEELARIWLKTAREDILWAKHDLRAKFYSRVSFISQQAAEKALKSYLFSCKEKLVRTHDLLKLLRICQKYDASFSKLEKHCNILTDYYTDTRYPDIWDITRFEDQKLAQEALKLAKEVVDFIGDKIKIV